LCPFWIGIDREGEMLRRITEPGELKGNIFPAQEGVYDSTSSEWEDL
jgi:hypothetical protein